MTEADATTRGGKHVRKQMESKRTLMLDLTAASRSASVATCFAIAAKQDLRRNSAPAAIWAPKRRTTILLATMRAEPDSVRVGA